MWVADYDAKKASGKAYTDQIGLKKEEQSGVMVHTNIQET